MLPKILLEYAEEERKAGSLSIGAPWLLRSLLTIQETFDHEGADEKRLCSSGTVNRWQSGIYFLNIDFLCSEAATSPSEIEEAISDDTGRGEL